MIRQDGGGLVGPGYVNIPTMTAGVEAAPIGNTVNAPGNAGAHRAPGLLEVLWQRRWTFALTVMACLAGAAVYLTLATPIYLASSKVALEQNAPKAYSESRIALQGSEGFLATEADALMSLPVLNHALEQLPARSMKTFEKASGDWAAWLRRSGALKAEVSRKADVITVSMESPYTVEATEIVAAVVNAYIAEQTREKQSTGTELIRVLQKQRDQIAARLDAAQGRMLKLKLDKQALSLKDDASNALLAKTATLSKLLTDAEIATIELKAQEESIKAALAMGGSVAAFIESQQLKVKESGDHELDELRSQLGTATLQLTTTLEQQGPNHPKAKMFQEVVDGLKKRLADKERSMADAHLLAVSTQLRAAQEKEKQLRGALETHQREALGLSPAVMEYAKAEAEAGQLQKQLEILDPRISEVNVNQIESRPLNYRILEPARADEKPVKPVKSLILSGALMAGCMLGMALSMLREWMDARLRKPEQIQTLLGTSVIATVPRINMRLAASVRGQIVKLDTQSAVAEAYRSVRTSIYLGTAREARTILVASPAPGDGKSTTASNLAIAFAQAGDRVLLIDCDLRQPVQHHIFEMSGDIGLSSIMAGQAKLKDAIRPTSVPGLHLLSGGPLPQNPSELLTGKKFKRLMQVLSNTFDRIVIDSPPLMRFNDGRILAASADVTLLVLRMNQSVRALGMLAMERLAEVGANLMGAIANDVPSENSRYYYYGSPWQYARRTPARLLNSDWSPAAKNAEATAAVAREPGRVNTEMLAIAEPDWSSEGGT